MQANETDFGPHVKDIAEALENKLDEATIVEELRQYVENYGIDLATAKEAIVRKHYGDPRTLQASAFMPLANIKADESAVSFRAKIVSVFSKEINLKDGSQKTIFEGEIADGSATLRFTVWRDEFTAEPGTILEVTNAYSKGWKDRVDLNLGDRCRVREVEDEGLAALDVPAAGSPTADSASDVAGLRDGMGSVTLTVRILDVQEREVTVRGEPKALWSGTLADASGSCRFTAWHDHKLQADTIYEIGNAYVREWQGIPELQINENTAVGTVDAELPSLEELAVGTSYTIDLLDERGGASDALLEGHVLAVREGSGLIFRCPECNRVLRSRQCMVHGEQEGQPDLRTKLLFDDGTGSLQLFLNRELTEKVLGRDLDSCLELVRENYSAEALTEELEQALLLKPLTVEGYTRSDDYGLMFFARKCQPAHNLDVPSVARQFLAALEA